MTISPVSRTAILTLIARVVLSERNYDHFNDPTAELCLDRLTVLVSEEDRLWILRERKMYSGSQMHHAKQGLKRVRYFDDAANRFIAANPGCTVVSLGCGFDTRFWRIANGHCRYIEIDLAPVVDLKKEIFKDQSGYEMIGCSVLDPAWIERVAAHGTSGVLLLAEGLFAYIPEPDAAVLFQRLTQNFYNSQIILDIVPESWTKGLVKWLISLETKYTWGFTIPWAFGIRNPRDLEAFAPGLKLLETENGAGGPIMTLSINAG